MGVTVYRSELPDDLDTEAWAFSPCDRDDDGDAAIVYGPYESAEAAHRAASIVCMFGDYTIARIVSLEKVLARE